APRLDDFPLVTAWFTEGKEERDTEADSIGSVVLKGEAFTLLLIWMIKRMILPWKWRAVRAVKASSMQSISRNGMNEIYRSVSICIWVLSDNDTLSKSAIFVVAPLTASSTKGYESKEKNEKHISNLHKDTNQYELGERGVEVGTSEDINFINIDEQTAKDYLLDKLEKPDDLDIVRAMGTYTWNIPQLRLSIIRGDKQINEDENILLQDKGVDTFNGDPGIGEALKLIEVKKPNKKPKNSMILYKNIGLSTIYRYSELKSVLLKNIHAIESSIISLYQRHTINLNLFISKIIPDMVSKPTFFEKDIFMDTLIYHHLRLLILWILSIMLAGLEQDRINRGVNASTSTFANFIHQKDAFTAIQLRSMLYRMMIDLQNPLIPDFGSLDGNLVGLSLFHYFHFYLLYLRGNLQYIIHTITQINTNDFNDIFLSLNLEIIVIDRSAVTGWKVATQVQVQVKESSLVSSSGYRSHPYPAVDTIATVAVRKLKTGYISVSRREESRITTTFGQRIGKAEYHYPIYISISRNITIPSLLLFFSFAYAGQEFK
ncbi:hypothetical protein ACJX0J_003064, partial (mitochondrion) [Zea mays]